MICSKTGCLYLAFADRLCNNHYAEANAAAIARSKAYRAFGITQGAWVEDANCAGIKNPEIFHDPARRHEALAVCETCPVMQACADSRINNDDGVWGGEAHYTDSQIRRVEQERRLQARKEAANAKS